jgi:hypothetical protein
MSKHPQRRFPARSSRLLPASVTLLHNRLTQELLIEDRSGNGTTFIEYAEEGLRKFEFAGLPRKRVIKKDAQAVLNFGDAIFSLKIQSSPHLDSVKTITLSRPIPRDLESSFMILGLPATLKHTRVHTPPEQSHQEQGICHYHLVTWVAEG